MRHFSLYTTFFVFVLIGVLPLPIHAATIVVDDAGDAIADDGVCTLR